MAIINNMPSGGGGGVKAGTYELGTLSIKKPYGMSRATLSSTRTINIKLYYFVGGQMYEYEGNVYTGSTSYRCGTYSNGVLTLDGGSYGKLLFPNSTSSSYRVYLLGNSGRSLYSLEQIAEQSLSVNSDAESWASNGTSGSGDVTITYPSNTFTFEEGECLKYKIINNTFYLVGIYRNGSSIIIKTYLTDKIAIKFMEE